MIKLVKSTLVLFCMYLFCFFNDTATTEIYTSVHTLSLHDALPILSSWRGPAQYSNKVGMGTSMSSRSEEHTSELQSRTLISYAVFCLQKKKTNNYNIKMSSLFYINRTQNIKISL